MSEFSLSSKRHQGRSSSRRKTSNRGRTRSQSSRSKTNRDGWTTFGNRRRSPGWEFLTGRGNFLEAIIDVGLLITCLTTVLVMGGRTAIGQFVFLAMSLLTAGAFFVSQWVSGKRVRPRWADLWIGLAVAVVAVQLVPVSTEMRDAISPAVAEILPAWGADDAVVDFPVWDRLSLAPYQTWSQLGLVLTGWLVLITARHRLSDHRRAVGFLDLYCTVAAGIAIFGIVQWLFGNGKFFWFYDYPFTTAGRVVRGPFSNPNHMGGFLALATVWPMWRLLAPLEQKKDEFGRVSRRPLIWSITVLTCLLPAVLATQSRIGLLATSVAIVSVVFVSRAVQVTSRSKEQSSTFSGQILGTVVFLLLLGTAALTLFGSRIEADIEQNVLELTSGDIEQLDRGEGRRNVWATAVEGAKEFPLFGIGLGAHVSVHRHYWRGETNGKLYTHVENGPLQLWLEIGSIGTGLVAVLVLATLVTLWRRRQAETLTDDGRAILGVAIVFLVTTLLQSLTDFAWHAPGYMLILLCIMGAGLGIAGKPVNNYGPRLFPALGTLTVLVTAFLFGPGLYAKASAESAWFAYVRSVKSGDSSQRAKILQLKTLLSAHQSCPDDPDINAALSRQLLWAFDLGQKRKDRFALADLRDVVRAGGWEDVAQVDEWLKNDSVAHQTADALRESRRLALQSLRVQPMNIKAINNVIKTQFLVDVRPTADEPLYEQLAAIAPDSAVVAIERATELSRLGRFDEAVAAWTKAYQMDARIRPAVGALMARELPATELLAHIPADAVALEKLSGVYAQLGRMDDERVLAAATGRAWRVVATDAHDSTHRIHSLRKSVAAFQRAEDWDNAESIARESVALAPTDIVARQTLGELLRVREHWAEAAEHLVWCSQQKPNDAGLKQRAARCLKKSREYQSLTEQNVPQLAAPPLPSFQ